MQRRREEGRGREGMLTAQLVFEKGYSRPLNSWAYGF